MHCELPVVFVNESDEKLLFDITVQIRYGDYPSLEGTCSFLLNKLFLEFPPQLFLQRSDLLTVTTLTYIQYIYIHSA